MAGTSRFTTYKGVGNSEAAQYRFNRSQASMTTCAFGDLSDILGRVQQQLGQNKNPIPRLVKADVFMQQLESWLHSLPPELLLPAISESQQMDQRLLKSAIDNTHEGRKVELVRIYFFARLT
jgi:hypothetical protein